MQGHYLGDGVYVDFDGHCIVLMTSDGIKTTNTIYLEPDVFDALHRFVAAIKTNTETVKAEAE